MAVSFLCSGHGGVVPVFKAGQAAGRSNGVQCGPGRRCLMNCRIKHLLTFFYIIS